jgi:hypothetical protein
MSRAEAARVLGVAPAAPWADVRRAYRDLIRHHHPDRVGAERSGEAVRIIEAFGVLERTRDQPPGPVGDPAAEAAAAVARAQARARSHVRSPAPEPPADWRTRWSSPPPGAVPEVTRLDPDTIFLAAPADEAFRWMVEVAHDVGEITYLDRSVPILEVLCRFVGEPATSLVITVQGRAHGTEAFCTAESIEARTGPPTEAVVDLVEAALRARTLLQ